MGSGDVAKQLRAVVSYFAENLNPKPGKVQLFKLMFLADFTARARLGYAISGDSYVRLPLGPVPRLLHRDFWLITKGCVKIRRTRVGNAPHRKMELHPIAQRAYKDVLDREEIEILSGVCQKHGRKTGRQLIQLTHEMIPFLATKPNAEIRFGLARYLDYQPMTSAHLRKIVERDRGEIAEAIADARKQPSDHQVGA